MKTMRHIILPINLSTFLTLFTIKVINEQIFMNAISSFPEDENKDRK